MKINKMNIENSDFCFNLEKLLIVKICKQRQVQNANINTYRLASHLRVGGARLYTLRTLVDYFAWWSQVGRLKQKCLDLYTSPPVDSYYPIQHFCKNYKK